MAKDSTITIDRAALVRLLSELVAVPSVNPGMDAGSAGECALGDLVAAYGSARGFRVSTQEVWPDRHNVLLDLGLDALPTLALVTHLDTVPTIGLTARAAAGTVEDGRLYGRGACDAKGSLAAMLTALALLAERRERLRVNVQVAAMVDEEHTAQGVLAYLRQLPPGQRPLAAIVGEPSRLEVVVAHKGVVRFRLRVRGRAAHTAEPGLGINAVDKMVEVLSAIRRGFASSSAPPHPLLGRPTLTLVRIEGGVAPNVVPESCTATFDRRLLPGERAVGALAWCDGLLDRLRTADPHLDIEREEPFVIGEALETDAGAPIVRAMLAARAAVVGPSLPIGVPFGTDGSPLSVRGGIPTVVCGPGDIAQAHTADEFVPIDDLVYAAAIYVRCALAL